MRSDSAPRRRRANIDTVTEAEAEAERSFVEIRIWDRSALVLLDWLLTTDESALPYAHPSQKQALRDLSTALEWARGLGYDEAEVAAAREQVSMDMSEDDRLI
jgi:hypothetical protein